MQTPRREASVLASTVEADKVSGWVAQARFAPKPTLVFEQLVEDIALQMQLTDFSIEFGAFKVDHDIRFMIDRIDVMQRERGLSLWRFKACVMWSYFDDEAKTDTSTKID